jgi:hypothetical protein
VVLTVKGKAVAIVQYTRINTANSDAALKWYRAFNQALG